MVDNVKFYPNAYNEAINISTVDKYQYNESESNFVFEKPVNNRVQLKEYKIILGEKRKLW